MGRVLYQAMTLVALGLIAGMVHSCARPVEFHPRNNPEPADAGTVGGTDTGGGEPKTATSGGDPAASPAGAGTPPAETTPAEVKPAEVKPPAPATAEPNYFITVARAKELWDQGQRQGNVFFVDARNQQAFVSGHVAGAMNILPGAFSGTPAQAANYLPGMTVVVYCTGRECTDSEAVMVGLQNMKKGIGPIYIMHDGYQAWASAGHPVATGQDLDHP